jgi:Na+/melibiose symporter-like transporter
MMKKTQKKLILKTFFIFKFHEKPVQRQLQTSTISWQVGSVVVFFFLLFTSREKAWMHSTSKNQFSVKNTIHYFSMQKCK